MRFSQPHPFIAYVDCRPLIAFPFFQPGWG
ncbi:hypothetical protein FHR80_001148 [Cellulomonas cellasea]|uniref:Uncharacterized protein n=1 Tax=Cellulomonas cellasea TaxID=43670 RepID=A0A7W4UDM0_9CELL|nr:hypothetical protein [Cellulomonas cellasea]